MWISVRIFNNTILHAMLRIVDMKIRNELTFRVSRIYGAHTNFCYCPVRIVSLSCDVFEMLLRK